MIFKKFSPKNSAKNLALLTQNKAKLCKIFIITLVFLEKRQFFGRKLSKIAENCDHNIDPQFSVANQFRIECHGKEQCILHLSSILVDVF
jgi:hypothetical protein